MFSHHLGRALAIASAVRLSACKTFSPDGGMGPVAAIAGGLNKDLVPVSTPEEAAYARQVCAPAESAAHCRCGGAGCAP